MIHVPMNASQHGINKKAYCSAWAVLAELLENGIILADNVVERMILKESYFQMTGY